MVGFLGECECCAYVGYNYNYNYVSAPPAHTEKSLRGQAIIIHSRTEKSCPTILQTKQVSFHTG